MYLLYKYIYEIGVTMPHPTARPAHVGLPSPDASLLEPHFASHAEALEAVRVLESAPPEVCALAWLLVGDGTASANIADNPPVVGPGHHGPAFFLGHGVPSPNLEVFETSLGDRRVAMFAQFSLDRGPAEMRVIANLIASVVRGDGPRP